MVRPETATCVHRVGVSTGRKAADGGACGVFLVAAWLVFAVALAEGGGVQAGGPEDQWSDAVPSSWAATAEATATPTPKLRKQARHAVLKRNPTLPRKPKADNSDHA